MLREIGDTIGMWTITGPRFRKHNYWAYPAICKCGAEGAVYTSKPSLMCKKCATKKYCNYKAPKARHL